MPYKFTTDSNTTVPLITQKGREDGLEGRMALRIAKVMNALQKLSQMLSGTGVLRNAGRLFPVFLSDRANKEGGGYPSIYILSKTGEASSLTGR